MIEPAYLTRTRIAYDTVAENYAEVLRDALREQPFDRAMLALFAELVHAAGEGPVVDVGCGPGRITTHLHTLGLPVLGVDLSPEMIATARRLYPELRFQVGAMAALELPAGELAGLVAWYSIIHTPPESLPTVFAEFARVLRPGGHLLLAFQVGDERRHITQAYGHEVSADAYRLPPERVADLVRDARFAVLATMVRELQPPHESTPQAYLLARRDG